MSQRPKEALAVKSCFTHSADDGRHPLAGGPAGAFAVPSRQAAARTLRSSSRSPRRAHCRDLPAFRRAPASSRLERARDPRRAPDLRAGDAWRGGSRRCAPSGRAASGNDFPVVVEGNRHRAQLPPRRRVAHRAGRALSHRDTWRRRSLERRSRGAPSAHPRSHDRSGARRRGASVVFVRARRAEAAHVHSAGGARRREPRARTRARARRDRVSRSELPEARPRSDRRRAHDVRAGELRALPPQDLQRKLDRRRRRAGQEPVRDDPRDASRASARNGRRVFRQLGRDGGRDGRALSSAGRGQVRRRERAHAHAHEGRDAQPSDRDRAFPGGRDRFGRRNPRRGRDRHRCQAQGWARGLHRVEPAHSRSHACVGAGLRQAGPHRIGTVDHDRGPHRRRVVQQRVRPSEPHRLFPYVRAAGRRRSARLSQADHDRRRRGQHPRGSHAQARAVRRHAVHPTGRPGHADRHGRRRRVVDGHRR